jgi:hypothetical protein
LVWSKISSLCAKHISAELAISVSKVTTKES